jgi:hypothetical protein
MITALTGIRRAVAVILAASLGVCCLPSGAAIAQNEAVLILDNSGSMWGRMDGTPKISVVRDAVGSLLKEKAGKLDLGILAYGTQKSKDCSSTETLKPIGAIDPAADAKTVDGANPKGSAPVAASLTAASQLFQTKTGVRSIILLSDSTDDCKADPCAVAEQLKAQSPLTVIHVIGFDEKSEDELQELACISEQTSGVFQTAQTPGELNEALRKAIELAELGMTENAEGRQIPILALPQAGFGPGGENSFTSNEPGTLVLSAMLAEGGQPLNGGLVWRVFDGQVLQDGSYKLLHRFPQAQTSVKLPPGDYLVNAAYGRANLTKRLTVWPGMRQEDVFNLNAGGLRLYATLAKQPLLSEQTLSFDVFSEESDQFGNRRRVVAGAKSGVVLRLNSGNYRVESTYGDANAILQVDVTVEPGKLTEATLDHQAGKVSFRLVEKAGGEALADTIWQIFSNDGQLVKRSGGAFPSHVLAAGSYEVRVEHGAQEYAAKFAVDPGEKKRVEVVKP